MAGCVFSVSLKVSSGPSKHRRESSKPSAWSACSKMTRAAGNVWARLLPMPANCEPCPGNRKAVFMANHLLYDAEGLSLTNIYTYSAEPGRLSLRQSTVTKREPTMNRVMKSPTPKTVQGLGLLPDLYAHRRGADHHSGKADPGEAGPEVSALRFRARSRLRCAAPGCGVNTASPSTEPRASASGPGHPYGSGLRRVRSCGLVGSEFSMRRKRIPASEQVVSSEILDKAKRAAHPDKLPRSSKCSGVRRRMRLERLRTTLLGVPPPEDQRLARIRAADASSGMRLRQMPDPLSSTPAPGCRLRDRFPGPPALGAPARS